MSDSPELVNFAVGLVNSVPNLCEDQVMAFGGIYRNTVHEDKFKIHVN